MTRHYPTFKMEFKVPLSQVRDETPDSKTFIFTKPQDLEFSAGQFMRWYLPHDNADERGDVRPFSIIASPTENNLAFTTKFTDPGSSFKKALLNLSPGYEMSIRGPFGHFTLPVDSSIPVVMLSGGVGITPFRSMIKYATDLPLNTSLTLLYANKTPKDIIYRAEFDSLSQVNPNFKAVYTVDNPDENWAGETGRLTGDMIRKFVPEATKPIFLICGPAGMVESYAKILTSLGVAPDRIRTENFSGY